MNPRAYAVLREIHYEMAYRRWMQLRAAGVDSALQALTETVGPARAAYRALPRRQRLGLAPRQHNG